MKRIDHIGIATRNIEETATIYMSLFNAQITHREEIHHQGIKVAFISFDDNHIELIEPIHADSAVARFIEKRGTGMHHLAFEVPDISVAMRDALSDGYQLINETPVRGAKGKWICFLHPKTTDGVLIELIQKPVDYTMATACESG